MAAVAGDRGQCSVPAVQLSRSAGQQLLVTAAWRAYAQHSSACKEASVLEFFQSLPAGCYPCPLQVVLDFVTMFLEYLVTDLERAAHPVLDAIVQKVCFDITERNYLAPLQLGSVPPGCSPLLQTLLIASAVPESPPQQARVTSRLIPAHFRCQRVPELRYLPRRR